MRACTSRSPCSLLVLVLVIAGFAVHRPSSLRFVMGGCDGVADFVVSILHRDSSHESVVTVCCLMSVEPRRVSVCGPVWDATVRAVRGCGRRVRVSELRAAGRRTAEDADPQTSVSGLPGGPAPPSPALVRRSVLLHIRCPLALSVAPVRRGSAFRVGPKAGERARVRGLHENSNAMTGLRPGGRTQLL